MTDEERGRDPAAWLAACRAGEPEAWRALGRLLQRVARSRLRGTADRDALAEDCAQDALLGIWRRLERGAGPEPERFVAFAAATVVHKVYDALRRRGTLPSGPRDAAPERRKRVPPERLESLEARLEATSGPARALPDNAALAPEAAAEARAAFEALAAELARHPRLSEASREVLGRGFLEEQDDAELAQVLGTSRGNVHVIRSRNLAKLRGDEALMARLRALYLGRPAE